MFKTLLRKFMFWFTRTRFYGWFMDHVMWRIAFTTTYLTPDNPKYKKWGPLVYELRKVAKPGDFLFTINRKNLSGKIIGAATAEKHGDISFVPAHVAHVVGNSNIAPENHVPIPEVIEMTHSNFTRSMLDDVCHESTAVLLGRCEDFDEKYVKEVFIPGLFEQDHKEYDDSFSMSEDKVACSEIGYHADEEKRLDVSLDPIVGLDPYLTPMGVMRAKNMKIIWDSRYAL